MEKGLGLKIQRARKDAGFTQQQLCQTSGLSYSTLAKIERGAIKAPSVFTIQQISGSLGISIEQLIGAQAGVKTTNKKRSKTGVEFVYFDVNGCLIHFYHRAFSAIAEKTGVGSDIIETTFWHYNDLVCRGDMSLAEFNNVLAEKLKIKSLDWAEYYLDAVEPVPEAIETLNWAIANYRVGLLSNIMPGLLDKLIEKGLLPDVNYDAIIDSSKTGQIKPEQEIFEIAQKASGVKNEEILFVDDSRANVMAAGKLGWHVVWFDDSHPEEACARIRQTLEF